MRCDGCDQVPEKLQYVTALGHTMRYCAACLEVWQGFTAACEVEGLRVQRLLDLWELDTRARLPLKLTPLDLPAVTPPTRREPMVLG